MNELVYDEEYIRIKGSFLHFLKYCKINDHASKSVINFKFWDHLKDVVKLLVSEDQIIILKSKQIGISYLLAFYALWRTLTTTAFNCLIISAGKDEAAELLDKALFAYDNLPDWLKLKTTTRSTTEIEFEKLKSRIKALPSTKAPGVGNTASLVILDEEEFHEYPESDWATSEAAANNGGQVVMVSTVIKANRNSLFKQKWDEAKKGLNDFCPLFLGCFVRPDRDDKWYEGRKRNYISDPDFVLENYPRTEAEALSPIAAKAFFNGEVLLRYLDQAREPKTEQDFIKIFQEYQNNQVYAIACDVSQGLSHDYQAAWVLTKRGTTVQEAALIHANDMFPNTYAYWINEIGKRYNYPVCAVETNGIGSSVLTQLIEIGYPYLYTRKGDKLGWYTSGSGFGDTRPIMLSELAQAISDGIVIVNYKPAIEQLLDFHRVEGREGKIEIKSLGKNDDLVMALAIGYQVIKDLTPSGPSIELNLMEEKTQAGMYA